MLRMTVTSPPPAAAVNGSLRRLGAPSEEDDCRVAACATEWTRRHVPHRARAVHFVQLSHTLHASQERRIPHA